MDLGVKGLGNKKSSATPAPKQVNVPLDAPVTSEAPVTAASDALALGGRSDATTSCRQLAREFAEKYTRLQAASSDPVAFEQTADAIGTPQYVVIDAVVRLCRDTQGEPLEERLGALNMIQHMFALPDEMRREIEADLKRTSSAA